MEVLKALQMLATVDLRTDTEAERTAKVKSLKVVDEQLTQPMLRTTTEFDKLLEFGVYALLRMLQDSDMNVWSLAEQVLVKTVKVLETTHRDKIVTEVWKGVKGSRVEGRSRRFAIELFALYAHRIKPSKADKFREALLRNLVSIARQEDDQLLQEALSKCIDPIITHQLAHAPLADLDPFLDELAANVRSSQGRVRRSAVTCIVALCRGHKQHLDLFVSSVRRMLNLILINASRETSSSSASALSTLNDAPLIDDPDLSTQSKPQEASDDAPRPTTPLPLPELPLKPELLRKPITDSEIADKLVVSVANSSSATIQGVLHCIRQLLRLNIEYVQKDVYAMPNPMAADLGTFARIASLSLRHEDTNVVVESLELLQEIFENNWQPLVQLGGTGFQARPEKDEITSFIEHTVESFENMLFDQQLRISAQVLVVACFCSLSLSLPLPLQRCLKRRLPQFMDLLKHTDPLLRGQAYYFIGCFICGWLQSKHRIEWPELDVFELLGSILHSTMQDDSAIAAKMACEGLSICTEPLLASEYAFFVPYMLQHLMCLSQDAYQLLKVKTFSLMSKIDYRMISYLEKSMKKVKASDYKPSQVSQQTVNLLGDDWSDGSVSPAPQVIAERPSAANAQNSAVVRLPAHLTIGNQKLQNSVVDFLISFLQNQEHRVRHKAGATLVKLVPQLNYSHFFDTAERRQYVVALRILDMQTSQHMSAERNNEWKEHTDWLLWKLVPKINQAVESLFLKGFYHFLRVLLEKGYTLPGQLIGIILDQLACSNLATDLDTQLDIFVMMSHLVKHLNGPLASYTQRIFVHVLRILHILSSVLLSKPIPSFKETKPGTEKDLPAGAVQGQPQYLQLWERLHDTFRLSLTSLNGNLFDEFCVSALKAISLIASAMGKGVVPYVEEVLGYVNDHFERNTEEVLECIQALLEAALSDTDLVQERGISTVLEPLPRTDDMSADGHVHNIVDLTTPNYETLLNPVVPSQRKANASSLTKTNRAGSPPSSPSESPSTAAKDHKRKIFKVFEPTLKRCIDHYLCTQAVHRRRSILQLLTHIIATLRLVLDYRSLDRDASFIRQVHGHLMRTSALHNEIAKSKGVNPGTPSTAPGTPTSTPLTPKIVPGGTGSPLGMSTDSATAPLSTLTEGTALQLSEIAATQLAFLYEMLFHCGISWNGADLITLIPLAFTSSWQPGTNQAAFEDIANILFTENLLKQWKECPKHHSLGKPGNAARGSAPPGIGSPLTRSNSSTTLPKQDPTKSSATNEDWISESILGDMRNQFVTQLLMLLPDPRAINLLSQVLELLQSFKNTSPYLEISSVVHDGLITILLDEGTTVLFAKSSIRDLLAMFSLIDHLPTETLNLSAIAATFVSIAKFSLHFIHSEVNLDLRPESPATPVRPKTPPSSSSDASSNLFDYDAPPVSAIPKSLKPHIGVVGTPSKISIAKTPSRPLTPADLGIVSPLPMSPAHKEETLRERSKRRVVEHERRYYAAHDRAWLPRCAFLLRILSRFTESQILSALSNPIKTDLVDCLPSDVDVGTPEGVAKSFSLLLTALLERGASGLSRGVSSEYYEDWTRQVCILTHLITYVVDSPARKNASKGKSSSSQRESPTPTFTKGTNIFDDMESHLDGEVDLLITTAKKKTFILPEVMASVLSSLNLTNMLYGAVQSKFSAVAFSLCKLFQNLHLPDALQAVLKFTATAPTKTVKASSVALQDDSLSGNTSTSNSGTSTPISSASTTTASRGIGSAMTNLVSSMTSNLPWTWYREVLHMAAFSAFCRVTCSSASKAELSVRREVIATLLANHDNLDRIIHQAHNADIKRLFSIYPISIEQQAHILAFIANKMERNRVKETLEPYGLHQLLLLTTYLPPTEQMLQLLLEHFLSSPFISVVISAEQYFINLLSRLEITISPLPADGSEPLEALVKRLISSRQSHLRTTFRKKLAKSGWLLPMTTSPSTPSPSPPAATSSFSTALAPSIDLLGTVPSTPPLSPGSATPHLSSPIQPRRTPNPETLIEDLIMEHCSSRKVSTAEAIDLLCSSMSSPSLFKRMLKKHEAHPLYLSHCLSHHQCVNVKEEILFAIAITLRNWFEKHSIVVPTELDQMLTQVEDQSSIGRIRGPPKDLPPVQSFPEIDEPIIAHLHSDHWRANVELLRLVVTALEKFGDHPVLAASSDSSGLITTPVDVSHSLDLLSGSPSATSSPAPSHSSDHTSEIQTIRMTFGPASIVALVSSSLRKLMILHETKTSVLSSFDVVVALKAAKGLFERFHFSITDLKTHPQLRKLIYRIYSVYFMLFKPSKKLILDYTSSTQVPKVLDFFYQVIRTLGSQNLEGDMVGWNQEQLLYQEVLQKLVQSSPSLEIAVFPLQDDPINFDYNNEPVELLEQFCQLINRIHFNYTSTFTAVWKQLMEGCDEEIPAVATSEAIKTITIRSMTSMLLRAGYKASQIPYIRKSSSSGEKGFNLGIPLLSLETLRFSNNSAPKFLGLDLSNMLTVFMNSVLKPLIETYVKSTTNEPAVGKECLKSLTLLSDHFSSTQWQWLHEYCFSVLDGQANIWDEDPLMRNYLVVSAAKSTAVLWPSMQPPVSQTTSAKLQRYIVFHIQNMRLREFEIHSEDHTIMPMAKNSLLIALHYVIQAKSIIDVRSDPIIWSWIELCAKSPSVPSNSADSSSPGSNSSVSVVSQTPSLAEQRILNTSALVRFLAKTCESLAPAQRDSDNREMAQSLRNDDMNQNEDDFDMTHMEEIKTLFSNARKTSSKSQPTALHADELVRSIIPHKLMQYFSAETIISNLLAELAKPEPGAQAIAFILHQVLLRLRATHADTLDEILSNWVLMTLPHFTIYAPQRMAQGQWALTALFLSASRNPVLRTLFYELTSTSMSSVDPVLFVLAGLDFFSNRQLSVSAQNEFSQAFNVSNNALFQSLFLQLQLLQNGSSSTTAAPSIPNLLD